MPLSRRDQWRPRGIEGLEPNAWNALRSVDNVCVSAGPGAGKTEFLAQRAVYLLETGLCPSPQRILAISFKTDAASNLATRVRERCPAHLADRFVSMTFDAFTKQLVDRFHASIPTSWRPTRPYEIAFSNDRHVQSILDSARANARAEWKYDIGGLNASTFEARHVGKYCLPLISATANTATEYAVREWWQTHLRGGRSSSLTFTGINRLAEVLLRANDRIAHALRATYKFVFIDEFQDTTYAQYGFVVSAFRNTRVTAVGDTKQRIMGWAGALPDAFSHFGRNFGAEPIPLLSNFRSSTDLVLIQHVIARALDAGMPASVSCIGRDVVGDAAQVWKSTTEADEAKYLADWLASDIRQRKKPLREYAILVRQKADAFEEKLAPALERVGVCLRNESRMIGRTSLQDMLVDGFVQIVFSLLHLGAERRSPAAWNHVARVVQTLRRCDPDDEPKCQRAESDLQRFVAWLRGAMASTSPASESASVVMDAIVGFLDPVALRQSFTEYRTGDRLTIMMESLRMYVAECAAVTGTWAECINALEGTDKLALMTVHKSKGLEYDTILFVGLDDAMWWSHSRGNPEGTATFFVALSRAKQRAIFTFCRARGLRTRVADLYELLASAGVSEVEVPHHVLTTDA